MFLDPLKEYPPNFLFQRDLYCASPSGVILGRPAAIQRRGEEVIQQSELAVREIPILFMPFGDHTLKGQICCGLMRQMQFYQQTIEATFISISNFNS